MKSIFNIVANSLDYLAKFFGLTYNQVNIIIYYFLIPLSWLVFIDIIIGGHFGVLTFCAFSFGVFVGCGNFKTYCDKVFNASALFLSSFEKLGSDYVKSSVIICVLVPIIVYITLIYFVIFQ